MTTTVDPTLAREIKEFGAAELSKCFHCGNCTAVCTLSSNEAQFPRRIVRYLQLGMKDRLLASVEPWLCYYCGECSASCPRQANPGETLMATRRYLTSRYDWTGLSKRLYLSEVWEYGALALVAAVVVALFYFLHGPIVTDRVALNTFAPVKWVELGDWAMGLLLSAFLLSNAARMHRFVMCADGAKRPPLSLYLSELKTLIVHALTQKRWRECGKSENNLRWIKHLLLVSGYVTMFVLVFVFLRIFQTDTVHPFLHPQRLLGYYATAVLLWVTADIIIGRLRRVEQLHHFSHPTDWLFPVLLFLTALSGIAVHVFRLAGMPLATYYTYVAHLAIAVPMLVIEVPFGKWAHLAYRPLALYFFSVREKARQVPQEQVETVTQAA
ncbi:MAG: 4Fe-4S dicluster domain-containing protein [bacterium]|nr:4Fe-4S dicluster domain-containing protein [bacterium]